MSGERSLLTAALALCTFAASITFASIRDEFDDEKVCNGNPERYVAYGGSILDRGITRITSKSSPQAAFIVVDFKNANEGTNMMHKEGLWDLTGCTISVDVKANVNFRNKQGVVGFKLIDADGSVYRTADDDLFKPRQPWKRFSQHIADLVPTNQQGERSQLDERRIVQYGVIFADRDDHEKETTFYIDNFSAKR